MKNKINLKVKPLYILSKNISLFLTIKFIIKVFH